STCIPYVSHGWIETAEIAPSAIVNSFRALQPSCITECNKGGDAMTQHKVGTREEWLAARNALLESEKELTRRSDDLARERRELPWARVAREYRFEREDGTKTLAEICGARSQLPAST